MSAAAGGFPSWVLLERYLFRRDDRDSFPDESEAPIRASATTSWGTDFSIAFSVVEPPRISRLYAHLPPPGFPHPDKELPLYMLATHRHLALFNVSSSEIGLSFTSPSLVAVWVLHLFIFRADDKNPSSSLLKLLPTCTEPEIDYSRGDERLRLHRQPSNATPRRPRLMSYSLGLWCGGEDKGEELVVAELTVSTLNLGRLCTKAFADICLLRSSFTGNQLGGKWGTMRVPILSTDNDDLWKLSRWQTGAIVPFQRWLCWIDYQQGILFCDVSSKVPTISFLWFPLDKTPACTSTSPLTPTYKATCNIFYGGVSVVDHGRLLKFIHVARNDGLIYEALKPGADLTITYHTLVLGDGSMEWKDDYTITYDELRGQLTRDGVPMFPRVDMDRPHVVHFLYIEFICGFEKMWVLSIDMRTKTVESFYLYMDVNVYLKMDDNARPQMDDADFMRSICMSPPPSPFLPCEFPRFCYLSSLLNI
ncbi:unnamed protein product [Urochloa decumbens]|uniref:DUF1618 domain-containing protein n=1 Tax=Urochloa decumbens TaxID=240449 RepID=A0ABC8VH12_9POAL